MPGPSYITANFCPRRRAFTLVEMLSVMGIIVILLAATLPALRGLNQSESRRGAVGNLMATLDRARMMAISDGLNTYVVFACPADASKINTDLLGRAYAIYEDGDNTTFVPQQKTPWMPLPKGFAFKVTESNGAGGVSYTSITNRTTPPSFRLTKGAATGAADVALPCWKFDATGAVADPPIGVDPHWYRLLLFPGSLTSSGTEISTQNGSGGPGNTQLSQLEEIDVNPVTGRAKYIIDPTNNLQSTPSSTP